MWLRWAKCWFGARRIAPSYYLECLVYSQPDSLFTGDLPDTFIRIGASVPNLHYGYSQLPRLAGEGNLLAPTEWSATEFAEFQRAISKAVVHASVARTCFNEQGARASWIAAFNGQPPS